MVSPRRTEHGQYRVAALTFLMCTSILIGSCSLTENPYESKALEGQEAIHLIDSMRANGSFEDARQRLNATARTIAERIVAAVPDQTWQFNTDPNVQRVKAGGLPCEKLTGSIAGRPMADVIEFGRTLSTEESPPHATSCVKKPPPTERPMSRHYSTIQPDAITICKATALSSTSCNPKLPSSTSPATASSCRP